MKMFPAFFRRPAPKVRISVPDRTSLSRTFVETGDERCPLAGIWSRLAEAAPASDEPELAQPALRGFLLWRAFHLPLMAQRYSIL